MTEKTFKLPDVGEGLTEAEIVQWRVKEGDTVAINDVIVEIETAKSLVELPSPFAGTVSGILAEEGTTVEVGTPIFRVAPAGGSKKASAKEPEKAEKATAAPASGDGPPSASLTGTGPKADAVRRRPRRNRHRHPGRGRDHGGGGHPHLPGGPERRKEGRPCPARQERREADRRVGDAGQREEPRG